MSYIICILYNDTNMLHNNKNEDNVDSMRRREILSISTILPLLRSASLLLNTPRTQAKSLIGEGNIFEVNDPKTYPAITYKPTITTDAVLIVVHGAGKNKLDISNILNISGEHSGLTPILAAAGKATPELYNNFIVISS